MKKSELQSLIRETVSEALVDMLPEIMSMIQENSQPQQVVESSSSDEALSLIRSKYKQSNPSSDHSYGLAKPNNKKGIVNGEPYASGAGILEWFSKQGGKAAPQRELSYTDNDMDKFMKKKFGV